MPAASESLMNFAFYPTGIVRDMCRVFEIRVGVASKTPDGCRVQTYTVFHVFLASSFVDFSRRKLYFLPVFFIFRSIIFVTQVIIVRSAGITPLISSVVEVS